MPVSREQFIRDRQAAFVQQETHLDNGIFPVFFGWSIPSPFVLLVYFKIVICDIIVNKMRFPLVLFSDLLMKMLLQTYGDFVEVSKSVVNIVERKIKLTKERFFIQD